MVNFNSVDKTPMQKTVPDIIVKTDNINSDCGCGEYTITKNDGDNKLLKRTVNYENQKYSEIFTVSNRYKPKGNEVTASSINANNVLEFSFCDFKSETIQLEGSVNLNEGEFVRFDSDGTYAEGSKYVPYMAIDSGDKLIDVNGNELELKPIGESRRFTVDVNGDSITDYLVATNTR